MTNMNAAISLSVNRENEPMIRILHNDKSDFLIDAIMGVFIRRALEEGIEIRKISSTIGGGESFAQYEITIKK